MIPARFKSQRRKAIAKWCFLPVWLGVAIATELQAAPHRYDHVIIVVEENRTPTEIIGDRVNAPYINSLADGGVRIGSMYALVHPSQPNYIHLFSGNDQGITTDGLPPNFSTTPTSTYPFRTPNVAAELMAAGFTFAGYSEQIEAAGTADWADYDPHSATEPNVYYRRKHNPWANWVAKVSPIPSNQLPSSVNKSFTEFPPNYSILPTVSFVVPNQLHDMHDGSRRQGDDWLRDNLGAYASWAKTNNSLLIITWDEDDYDHVNQIPTVFYGAALRDGTVTSGTWTLHNILRTIEDMYGLTNHAGSAAQVRPIIGPFAGDPPLTIATFRQSVSGYNGTHDTQLLAETPGTGYGTNAELNVDLDTTSTIAGNQEAQALVRFDSIFGPNAGQVPTNAIIQSAKLILYTPASPSGTDYDSDDTFRAHRMIMDWNDNATWANFNNGVSTDDIEAASVASFSLVPEVDDAPAIFDVTADIELFRTGAANHGWLLRSSTAATANGWTFASSEAGDPVHRPTLEILYTVITPFSLWASSFNLSGADAAPTADPDSDGASNLTEFAYNMNPTVPDAHPVPPNGTSGLPAAHYLNESGGILEVEFLRRVGPTAAGLTYAVRFSDNATGPWVNGRPSSTVIDANWQRVKAREATVGPAAHRFGRVMVTLQQ